MRASRQSASNQGE